MKEIRYCRGYEEEEDDDDKNGEYNTAMLSPDLDVVPLSVPPCKVTSAHVWGKLILGEMAEIRYGRIALNHFRTFPPRIQLGWQVLL
jgi:hypothetical protein